MPKLELIVRDPEGDVVPGATVSVFDQDTTTLSSLFSDFALTIATDNPGVSDDDGRFLAYAAAGYYDVEISRTGILTLTLEDVALPNAP